MNSILIIEDDPIIGNIYRSRIEKAGYKVKLAIDGQSGFYDIHEFQPQAVLLDLMLPKLNGVDLLRKIRAEARFQALPVIVFTNAYVPTMIQEALAAGATAVLNKATVTSAQVLDALDRGIHSRPQAQPAETVSTPETAKPAPPPPGRTGLEVSLGETSFHSRPPSPQPVKHMVAALPDGLPAAPPVQPEPTAPPVQPEPTPAPAWDSETGFLAELRQSFIDLAPQILARLLDSLQKFTRNRSDEERLPHLLELYRKVHSVTGSAGIAGFHHLSKMAAAAEALLKQLHDKPKNINPSTLRTVTNAVGLLGEILQHGLDPTWNLTSSVQILVVDDEDLSRRALRFALARVGLKAECVDDPKTALKLATKQAYDLIFLDVQMPAMNGFELCTSIHALPLNRATPVVFVTVLNDFTSRARSCRSGGTDLIAKPFLFIELGVKALTCVLSAQLAARGAPTEVRHAA